MRRIIAVCAMALALATTTPAHAVDVPAYGLITISNSGTGFVVAATYDDSVSWSCETTVQGQFTAPTAIIETCFAYQGTSFTCPLMVLTVHTGAPVSRAGGRASCTSQLDTGIISGANSAQRTGDLGRALKIVCTAYGGSVPLVPPYTVTCDEPGLPTP